ncbi:MAG: aldo/keto reductase [Candidatus Poribacteria bacterium]
MQYRKFGNTGMLVSALGFGCMRLPMEGGHVKEDYAIRMLLRAHELGVNYFDTAEGYCNTESQMVLGKAVKEMDRDKVYVSTKNGYKGDSGSEWRKRLETSLSRLDVDYIDVYHSHSLSWHAFQTGFGVEGGPLDEAQKAKAEGLIRHLAFSTHDSPENIIKLIDTGAFASMTVQYNLLNRANEEPIAIAHEKGMGVSIMGTVAGGRLAQPNEDIQKLRVGIAKSSAEIAVRFVLSNPGVSTALSGMNSIEQVEENVATASRTEPLTPAEKIQVLESMEENKRLADLYCTGCGYCMPCPNGVDIPTNFLYMNYYRVYGLRDYARQQYTALKEKSLEGMDVPSWADTCIECGECEPKCPQEIPIIKQLKETHAALG